MERISIFNYEAFYLDHLEGNLNEEDTALLLSFLSNHPELEVSLDDMPILPIEDGVFVSPSFENLKQVDYDSDVINMSNIETFAIAYSEKQLSEVKEAELKVFIAHNKEAKEIVLLFEAVKLVPDNSIIFEGKSSLKQQPKIVIWRYVAIAASIVGFVFALQVWNNNNTTGNQQMLAFEKLDGRYKDENLRVISTGNLIEKSNPTNNLSTPERNLVNNGSPQGFEQKNTPQYRKANDIQFAQLQKRTPELENHPSKDDVKIVEHPLLPINKLNPENGDNSTIAYNNMVNPIKPITNRLSDFTKTDIDLRTAKATEEQKAGFFLKIGKFEIERPSRKSN